MKSSSSDKEYGDLMLVVKSRVATWYAIMLFMWFVVVMMAKEYWQTQKLAVVGLGIIVIILSVVLICMRHRKISFFEKGIVFKGTFKRERMHYNDIIEVKDVTRKGPTTYVIVLKNGREFHWSEQEFLKLESAMDNYRGYMGKKEIKEVKTN